MVKRRALELSSEHNHLPNQPNGGLLPLGWRSSLARSETIPKSAPTTEAANEDCSEDAGQEADYGALNPTAPLRMVQVSDRYRTATSECLLKRGELLVKYHLPRSNVLETLRGFIGGALLLSNIA
jgi:hypothetical protein